MVDLFVPNESNDCIFNIRYCCMLLIEALYQPRVFFSISNLWRVLLFFKPIWVLNLIKCHFYIYCVDNEFFCICGENLTSRMPMLNNFHITVKIPTCLLFIILILCYIQFIPKFTCGIDLVSALWLLQFCQRCDKSTDNFLFSIIFCSSKHFI
jgi:hypothetical protein